ncbi:hypothetical protein Tco_1374468 [Tanacetum coccineum]
MRKCEDYCSDNLDAVSIKEDMAYLCLYFTRNHEELKSNSPYPEDSIRHIEDYLKIMEKILNVSMTRSSNKDLIQPFKNPKQVFRSSRKLSKTQSIDYLSSLEFNLISNLEDQFEDEETETIGEPTMEEYMTNTQEGYGSVIARPKIEDKDHFKLKGQFLKELRDNTFRGSDNEDANEHIEKFLEIVDLFHNLNITQNQVMLKAFPMSFNGAYCPPARTTKKMEEINYFQQDPDETLYQAWERFKELFLRCHQHYLTDMQDDAEAKKVIQEMANHS